MKPRQQKRRSRPEASALRAFRDAVRDILASEGWFELSLDNDRPRDLHWIPTVTAAA